MLLEFRVKNFRSLRDESILSLVASSDKAHAATNLLQTGLRAIPSVVRAAGIYGANASGKSNLVRAMQLMRDVVAESAGLQVGQPFDIQPFRLDPDTSSQPTEFEATFLKDGVRYQYGFELIAERITSEWLVAYKTAQPQNWYFREYSSRLHKDQYKFGSHLQGQRNLWKEATRPNALFLSTAVQLNSDQLKPVFEWMTRNLVIIENGSVPIFDYTVSHIRRNKNHHVKEFLSSADIGISDIKISQQKNVLPPLRFDLARGQFDNPPREERDLYVPSFLHTAPRGSAVLDFADESEGTQKLFALAGPMYEIFRDGRVLVVDELDRSLHALLVRQIVSMFQDPEINTNGAQLIFTTHDTSLLDADLLRRDQIWFTEKDADQASALYSLTDFSARKNEAFERGYLSGRYGAVPLLKRMRV